MNRDKKIQLIKLVNFATWKDCTIPCSEGINIIIADNNTGKSAIPKMFETICTYKHMSREHRESYIRLGCDVATMFIRLFDGTQFRFMFNKKQFSGAVIFPDGSKCVNTEDSVNIFKDSLGLIVDDETGLVANILDDKKRKVLIEVDEKESANLLSLMSTVPEVERIRELSSDMELALRQKSATANLVKNNILREMQDYSPTKINELRERRDILELAEKSMLAIGDVLQYIDDIQSRPKLENISCLDSKGLSIIEGIHNTTANIVEYVDNACDLSSSTLKIVEDLFNHTSNMNEFIPIDITTKEYEALYDMYVNVSTLTPLEEDDIMISSKELNIVSELYDLSNSLSGLEDSSINSKQLTIIDKLLGYTSLIEEVDSSQTSTKIYTNLMALAYKVSELKPFYSPVRLQQSSNNLNTAVNLYGLTSSIQEVMETESIINEINVLKGKLNIEDFKVCPKCGEVVI